MGENYRNPDTGQDDTSTEIPIQDVSDDAEDVKASETKDQQTEAETAADAEENSQKTAVSADSSDKSEAGDSKTDSDGKTSDGSDGDSKESEDSQKADETSDASESSDGADKKGGFFSRNKKPDKEKAQMKEKIDSLQDQVRRQMAEFDNYRKRTEREKEESFSMGEKNVIEKILPIVDNFERGFDTVEEGDKDDAFVTGMKKIYTQLMKQLTDLGVKPIEAVGKPFDPDYHNAVMQVDSDQYESGTVAQELQKGYLYHDKVIRHSMVAVVK